MLTTDERIKEIEERQEKYGMIGISDGKFLLSLVKVQRAALEGIVRDGDYSAPEGMTRTAKSALNWKEDV